MLCQGPVGVLLTQPHVQTCGLYLAAVQAFQQRLFVHVGAAGDVDDHHPVLHLRKALRVHQRFLPTGSAQHQNVRLGQQLVHGHKMHRLALASLGLVPVHYR